MIYSVQSAVGSSVLSDPSPEMGLGEGEVVDLERFLIVNITAIKTMNNNVKRIIIGFNNDFFFGGSVIGGTAEVRDGGTTADVGEGINVETGTGLLGITKLYQILKWAWFGGAGI